MCQSRTSSKTSRTFMMNVEFFRPLGVPSTVSLKRQVVNAKTRAFHLIGEVENVSKGRIPTDFRFDLRISGREVLS